MHTFQLLRAARLTALQVLLFTLQLSANSYSQTVTFSGRNVPLERVFAVIERQTGYVCLYDYRQVSDARTVTITATNKPLKAFLDSCFRGQPFGYAIEDRSIMITSGRQSLHRPADTSLPAALAVKMTIRGKVYNEEGQPLSGATITVIGTPIVVQTNEKGEFSLYGIDEKSTLLVSFVGFASRAIPLSGKETNVLGIVLKHSTNPLDEVKVIAYGTTTDRFKVGSVSVVTAKQIEEQPVTNVLQALEGRVPSLNITPTSGAPGSAMMVQIRGQNTLATTPGSSGYDQPLFIVDGVPFAPQNQPANQYASLANAVGIPYYIQLQGMSTFNSINPADIESITVLKDADATSIYGTQGSNGAILITTKRGKAGKTSVEAHVNTGYNTPTNVVHMMNTSQYLAMRRSALANSGELAQLGVPDNAINYPDLMIFDPKRDIDWFHRLEGGTARNTDAGMSLSGGAQNTTYLISGGYTHSGYNIPGNFADDRLTFHSSFHHLSADSKLTVDVGTDYSYDKNNSSGGQSMLEAVKLPPNAPPFLDGEGNLLWSYKGMDLTYLQPYKFLKQTEDLGSYNLLSHLEVDYEILPGLKLGALLGYSKLENREVSTAPLSTFGPDYYAYPAAAHANFGQAAFETVDLTPQLNYTRNIGRGRLSFMSGGEYKKNTVASTSITAAEYNSDALMSSPNGAAITTVTAISTTYKYAALFGRLGYIWNNKYILSFTAREDGSSNFGPGRQIGKFWSAGAGWIFSDERKVKAAMPFLSFGKLSGNYGISGSDGVAPYQYQANWGPVAGASFQGVAPFNPLNLENPDYSWDHNKKLNFSLDLGFFNDRLLLNATVYRNRTGDQLINQTIAGQTGFQYVTENFNATVQNSGWEVTLMSKNIDSKNFSWTTNFNISGNRNKLIAFPGLATSPYTYTWAVGKSTSLIQGYKYMGVNPATGIYQFLVNGVLMSNPVASLYDPTSVNNRYLKSATNPMGAGEVIGDLVPVFIGGFGNTFRYKTFSLSLFFQFKKQIGQNFLYQVNTGNYGTIPGFASNNIPAKMTSAWQKPGDHSAYQMFADQYNYSALVAGTSFLPHSSGAYSSASYIRLQTVAMEYSFPGHYLKKAGLKTLGVFLRAQNLFTLTPYQVGDPETQNIYSLPLQRTIVMGLNLTL